MTWASALLLPPPGLALLALLSLLLGWRRLAGVALLALALLATPAVVDTMLQGLRLPPQPVLAQPEAIVVFVGDVLARGDPSGDGLNGNALERLRTAARLQRRTQLPLLVSSSRGRGVDDGAAAMTESLEQEFRVPVRWTDSGSSTVWQSAAHSAALLHQAGLHRAILVADWWEMRVALQAFAQAGLEMEAAPVPRPRPFDGGPIEPLELLPFTPHWIDASSAIRQWTELACAALTLCASQDEPLVEVRRAGLARRVP